MTIKASRPAAWILAAGLLACVSAPALAAEGSPWPAANGAAAVQPSADGQQAAPPDQTATDPAAAQQQPDGANRSLSAEQRPEDATTPAETADASSAQAASNNDQGSDKASLVGKIFIAAGTLLTLGSAARMFMI
jgi:hypothetical protein